MNENSDTSKTPEPRLPEGVEAVFDAAAQLPPGERGEYLRRVCGEDARLREQVEELLKAHEAAGGFLEQPAAARFNQTVALTFPLTEKPGDRIGRYKLLQQIGEGGCGVVYMAEQEEPVRRRVALKVIKLGMDTKSVIARFEAERQALALMDHSNIAKVLDAGATENGRPYFVMELVRGIKITDYCDQNKLSTEERLKLFIQVCHAIQHAHQKGIVHRDIKPSNILVTLHDSVPVPKVIDFGIAKATQGRLTDRTLFTAFEQFIGTPAYMSPEQAEMSGLDIDTRCDVYALGVLLYELLTSQTPFDPRELMASGLDKMRQIIREQEPARPSTRLSTMLNADLTDTAIRRHTDAPRLVHRLRGDLDWIVMKALEKDRTRRYETAIGFAMDIQRHLANEPVLARPPSTLYRVQKLVRRNTLAVVAGCGVLITLALGFGVSTALFLKEREARQRADAAEKIQAQLAREAEAQRAIEAENVRIGRRIGMAALHLVKGRLDESEREINQVPVSALANFDAAAAIVTSIGENHARNGRWPQAIANLARRIPIYPMDFHGYEMLTPLLAQAGDTAAYRQHCELMRERFADHGGPVVHARIAEYSLLLPAPADVVEAVGTRADLLARMDPTHSYSGVVQFATALVEYRRGHFQEAATRAKRALGFSGSDKYTRAKSRMLLALTAHRLGRTGDARATLIEGLNFVNENLPRLADGLDDDWNNWLVVNLLQREAEALITPEVVAAAREAEQSRNEMEALRSRAMDNGQKERWKEAAADLLTLQELAPDSGAWYELAVILLHSGEVEDYRRQCEWILSRFGGTTNATLARRVAKGCLLTPLVDGNPVLPRSIADTVLSQASEWQENVMCLVEYRAGRFAEAAEWAAKSLARDPVDRRDAQTHLVLAMAHERLNQHAEARATLARAVEIIETMLPKLDSGDLGNGWVDRVIAGILLREANGLIEGTNP